MLTRLTSSNIWNSFSNFSFHFFFTYYHLRNRCFFICIQLCETIFQRNKLIKYPLPRIYINSRESNKYLSKIALHLIIFSLCSQLVFFELQTFCSLWRWLPTVHSKCYQINQHRCLDYSRDFAHWIWLCLKFTGASVHAPKVQNGVI